jgi:hypothetical protein
MGRFSLSERPTIMGAGMDRQVSISLGIVVARPRRHDSHPDWQTSRVMLGDHAIAAGRLLRQDSDAEYYFAGAAELRLDADEIDSYRVNLSQDEPRLYVVMAPREDGKVPPHVHLITADPDEAVGYLAAAPDGIEEIAMPPALAELISIFIDSHDDGDDTGDLGATLH